jgi:ribulose-phosphate 3-epimerase
MTSMRQATVIAPSLLSANFAQLGADVAGVVEAGADWVHLDVMDHHYVPNLTFGPMVCEAIRPFAGRALIDVHLMVEPVDALVMPFAKAGAGLISFHPEASLHVDRTLQLIRDQGCQSGLVFNPATPLHWLYHLLENIDGVMLLWFNPGLGGQCFIPSTLPKLRLVRDRLDAYARGTGRRIRLEVDGGVKPDNIASIARAGADTFVAGSAVFGSRDWRATIATLRHAAECS